MITQGQNKIFRALIWGKVGLCRPNMTRDMIKKNRDFQKCQFMLQNCKIWNFLEIAVLTFFIISPVIFGLQRRTLPQIEALEILFWPCVIIFSLTINICWAIMSRSCIGFFTQSIELRKRFLSDILILPWLDNFFSYFDKFLHFKWRYWCIWCHEKENLWI